MNNLNPATRPTTTPLPERAVERNGSATLSDRVRSLRLAGRGSGGGVAARLTWLPWGITGVMVVTTLLLGYRSYRLTPSGAGTEDRGSRIEDRGSQIRSSTLDPRSSTLNAGGVVLEAKGNVVPRHQVQVSPKVGGLLIKVNPRFEEGAKFEKDEWLGEIEDIDYKAEYLRAVATHKEAHHRLEELENGNRPEEIEQARKSLEENVVQVQDAQRELRRMEQLYQSRVSNQQDLDRCRKEYEAVIKANGRLTAALKLMELGPRKESIDQARARLDQAKADLDKAEWRLRNCKILAPITGTILKKSAEEGNLVNPSAFSNGLSASMCEMADLSDLEIDLNIQERELSNVEVGQPCWIMPEAFQKYEPYKSKYPRGYSGQVSRLMPIADRTKQSVSVRVKIEVPKSEAGVYLKPEMGAIVTFCKKESEKKSP